ncbi:MAG: BolA/IbaG family iron-sulfur metabolism protein [Spongiibacteraceae bacterium]|jgi:acid stress-induced BolA-like protein IbaG/YrbA
MQSEQIKELLQQQLADCDIEVGGDGRHVDIAIVGDVFEGLNAVKRQQLVYAALNEQIADGSVHAVNMKTYTRAEWQQHN